MTSKFGRTPAGYALAAVSMVVSAVKAAAAFGTGVIAVVLALLLSIAKASRGYNRARATGLAGYADAIRHGYFSVILLAFVENVYVDGQIERDVSLSARYWLINDIPYAAPAGPRDYLIWVRKGRR